MLDLKPEMLGLTETDYGKMAFSPDSGGIGGLAHFNTYLMLEMSHDTTDVGFGLLHDDGTRFSAIGECMVECQDMGCIELCHWVNRANRIAHPFACARAADQNHDNWVSIFRAAEMWGGALLNFLEQEIDFAPSAIRCPHGPHDANPRWTIERSPWAVPIGEIYFLAQSTLATDNPHAL